MDKELRILMLENDPFDAELEEHELRKTGWVFTLKVVDTKEAFLKELNEFLPDLILSEYDLPTFDGLAALRIAKEKCPDVPFIMVTGKLGEEFAIEKLKDGATDYVLKSNLKRLVPSVNRALEEAKLIAGRKQAEKALRESEERFRQIAVSAEEWIWEIDVNGLYTYSSPVVEKILGYKPEEIVGKKHFYDLFTPENREELKKAALEVFKSKQVFSKFVNANIHKSGHVVIMETGGTPILDEMGNLLGYRGADTDITERIQAENKINEQLEFLQTLLDTIPTPVFYKNLEGKYLGCNEAFELFTGRKKEELIGKTVYDMGPKEIADKYFEKDNELFQNPGLQTYEWKVRDKDGILRNVIFNKAPFKGVKGIVAGLIGVISDITVCKLAEEALEKRVVALTRPLDDTKGITFEELFNLDDIQQLQDEFARATGVASIITHPDGTPITAPSGFCRLCNDIIRKTDKGRANCFRSDAMIGRPSAHGPTIQPCMSGGLWDAGAGISVGGRHIANWLIGQVRDATQDEEKMRAYARDIGADEAAVVEAFRKVPAMSHKQFRQIAQVLFTLAKQLSATAYQNVQQARFITERKKFEDALRASEAELHDNYFTQAAINMVLSESLENIPLELMLQKALNMILSIPWLSFESIGSIHLVEGEPGILSMKAHYNLPKELRKICAYLPLEKCLCGKAAQTRKIQFADHIDERHDICYEGMQPHGHYVVPILFGGRTLGVIDIYLKEGHIRNRKEEDFLLTIADTLAGIIARKQIEEEKEKLHAQLLQAQKMEVVGQLAGGVAHDFNNILAAIIGYGHILKMKLKEEDPLRSYADNILSLSDRAANLTQSLLAFSRKEIMNPRPVDLNELMRRIDHLLLRIIGEDIKLQTMLSENALIVMADSGHIEHVLMNLATNAKDAMPKGGVLTIGTETVDIDHEFIKEYGFGKEGAYALIAVTDTGAGMDKETREKIFEPFFTTKEVGKGTGLGLSMVYGIIKQHDGHINVYSEPGRGTTFRIYLPLIDAKIDEIKTEVMQAIVTGTEMVLLAEDEIELREFTKKMLEEYGYKVITAASGHEAIDEFKAHKDEIRLLLFDVIMPNRNGREAYEEIKKMKPDIKALFMSGYPADVIHKHEIIEKGFAYIEKPVSPTKLLRKIREVLNK